MMKGIDVSDNQGYIDWNKVKNDGVEFAVLRSVRRSGQVDKQLASNIKGCLENLIPFDFYKYMYALTVPNAIKEANEVIEAIQKLGIIPSKNTVLWADVEDESQMVLSKEVLTKIVLAFKDVVEKAGYSFGLYMGKYWYEKGEIDTAQFDDHIWIARYYKGYEEMPFAENPDEAYVPKALAGKLWGWQYTSSGKVNGINGNVDLDIAYYDIKQTEVSPQYYQTPEFTLIDSLNKIGVDSSYKNRKLIALHNGIMDYAGTAKQNLEMLDMLNKGILVKI